MLNFVLIHDGTELGWQTAYRAFHVAARLGASLQALVIDGELDADELVQYAAEIKIGGNAARINLTTQVVTEFTEQKLKEDIPTGDGLFLPWHLVSDEKTAARYLEALDSPLWVISTEAEINMMGVLIAGEGDNQQVANYATTLSNRLRKPLVGFSGMPEPEDLDPEVEWVVIEDFSPESFFAALSEKEIDLLVIPASQIQLTSQTPVNCVIFPQS
jgi:hypothetical protein